MSGLCPLPSTILRLEGVCCFVLFFVFFRQTHQLDEVFLEITNVMGDGGDNDL